MDMDITKTLEVFRVRRKQTPLSSKSLLLYFIIADWCKEIESPEFTASNTDMRAASKLSPDELDRARGELAQKKFIGYKKGGGSAPGKYLLLDFAEQTAEQTAEQSNPFINEESYGSSNSSTNNSLVPTSQEPAEQPAEPRRKREKRTYDHDSQHYKAAKYLADEIEKQQEEYVYPTEAVLQAWANHITSQEPAEQPAEPRKKREKRTYDHDSQHYKAAKYLADEIEKQQEGYVYPTEAVLQAWANHIRMMEELDHVPLSKIKAAIDFARKDEFWAPNIMSGEKLRKQYNQLQARMQGAGGAAAPARQPERRLGDGLKGGSTGLE